MTATNHVLTGVLIGTVVHAPWLAIPLAFASHFVCDAIPHFDLPSNKKLDQTFFLWLAGDMALAASVLLSLWFLQPANVLLLMACGMAAASPDLMWLYYIVYPKLKHQKQNFSRATRLHASIKRYTGQRFWPLELTWFLVVGGLAASRLQ